MVVILAAATQSFSRCVTRSFFAQPCLRLESWTRQRIQAVRGEHVRVRHSLRGLGDWVSKGGILPNLPPFQPCWILGCPAVMIDLAGFGRRLLTRALVALAGGLLARYRVSTGWEGCRHLDNFSLQPCAEGDWSVAAAPALNVRRRVR